MAEHIEREAAYEKCGWYNTVNGKSVCAARKDELAAIPAADVAPVVHGRWENVCHYPYPDTIRCSVCGREFNGNEDWKGCPVCLARMDGE